MDPIRVTDEALLARIVQQKRVLPHISQEIQQSSHRSGFPDNDLYPGRYENKLQHHWEHTSLLAKEIEHQYGAKAPRTALDSYVKTKPKHTEIIDKILANRQRQHSEKQDLNAAEFRYLVSKRQQLQKERDQLQQQKELIRIKPAPVTSSLTDRAASEPSLGDHLEDIIPSPGHSSIQSTTSFINATNNRLPAQVERYKQLRADLENKYRAFYQPYDGHLGPQSYKSWQVDDYHMVRSIVDELVEKFLDNYFGKGLPLHTTGTALAIREAETEKWERQRKLILQATAIQLIMEEIVLQSTRKLAKEAAEEFLEVYKILSNRSNVMFTRAIQDAAKSEAKTESIVYTQLHHKLGNLQEDRKVSRLSLFAHSQPLSVKGRSRDDSEEY